MSNKIMREERTGGHYKISSICTYLSIYFNMLIFLKNAKNIVYIHLFLYVCNNINYTIALLTFVIKIQVFCLLNQVSVVVGLHATIVSEQFRLWSIFSWFINILRAQAYVINVISKENRSHPTCGPRNLAVFSRDTPDIIKHTLKNNQQAPGVRLKSKTPTGWCESNQTL